MKSPIAPFSDDLYTGALIRTSVYLKDMHPSSLTNPTFFLIDRNFLKFDLGSRGVYTARFDYDKETRSGSITLYPARMTIPAATLIFDSENFSFREEHSGYRVPETPLGALKDVSDSTDYEKIARGILYAVLFSGVLK